MLEDWKACRIVLVCFPQVFRQYFLPNSTILEGSEFLENLINQATQASTLIACIEVRGECELLWYLMRCELWSVWSRSKENTRQILRAGLETYLNLRILVNFIKSCVGFPSTSNKGEIKRRHFVRDDGSGLTTVHGKWRQEDHAFNIKAGEGNVDICLGEREGKKLA